MDRGRGRCKSICRTSNPVGLIFRRVPSLQFLQINLRGVYWTQSSPTIICNALSSLHVLGELVVSFDSSTPHDIVRSFCDISLPSLRTVRFEGIRAELYVPRPVIPDLFSSLFSMPSLRSLHIQERTPTNIITYIEWTRDIGGSIVINKLTCLPAAHWHPLDRPQLSKHGEVLSATKHLTITCRMQTDEKDIDDILSVGASIESLRFYFSSPPSDAPNPIDSLRLLSASTESLFIEITNVRELEEYRVHDEKLLTSLQSVMGKGSSLRSLHVHIHFCNPTDLGGLTSADEASFPSCRQLCAENDLRFECTIRISGFSGWSATEM